MEIPLDGFSGNGTRSGRIRQITADFSKGIFNVLSVSRRPLRQIRVPNSFPQCFVVELRFL